MVLWVKPLPGENTALRTYLLCNKAPLSSKISPEDTDDPIHRGYTRGARHVKARRLTAASRHLLSLVCSGRVLTRRVEKHVERWTAR